MHGAPVRLRCEYLENPLGIEDRAPRLSWWPSDPRPAELQTAYEIVAASTPDLLAQDEGDLWHSGRVESQQSFNVSYRGKRLVSGRRVWWKVRTFDSDGLPGAWSDAAFFEAGLLEESDWRGQWIAAGLQGSRVTEVPVVCLRRSFELAALPRQARIHIAALGLQQLEINGVAVNGDEQVPGWSDFNHQAPCLSYDVTDLLQAGSNVLAVLLADGWFCGHSGLGERQHYGERPELRLQLHVTLASGASMLICTDDSWQWRPSWILGADPLHGESCDWRQYDPTWSAPLNRAPWYPVEISERSLSCRALQQAPVRRLNELQLEPIAVDDQRYLFALPGPVFGRARLECTLPAGGLLRVRYGLELDGRGELIAGPGEDVHIARGTGSIESFAPRFALHGFRYLEVTGDLFATNGIEVTVATFGQVSRPTAEFICDHRKLNELFDTLVARLGHCQQSIPFAGLSAEHRYGALAGAGRRGKTSLLTLGVAAGIRNWLTQMRAEQLDDGRFPDVIPTPPDLDALALGHSGGDALLELSWQLFRQYGDRAVLETGFHAGRRYLAGLAQSCPDHICGEAPDDLQATLRYFRSVRTAARMAGVLGALVELEDFEMQAAAIRNAFRRRFVTPDGRLVGDDLHAYTGALSRGMLEPSERPQALTELFRQLDGQLSTQAPEPVADLLRTLTLLGRVDLAHALVFRFAAAENSSSDPAAAGLLEAGLVDWLLGSLAGMDMGRDLSDAHNAFRRMRIQPRPLLGGLYSEGEEQPEGPVLRAVEAALETISGRYEVSWSLNDESFELSVLVPCNCTADVILPDDSVHEIVAGRHEFSMPLHGAEAGIPILREVSAGN